MRFLFRLDLSLHADAEIFFWNFEFWNQTRARVVASCKKNEKETEDEMTAGERAQCSGESLFGCAGQF